jgi:membrane protease subunit (stomatin/prohibitin family)
MPNFLPSARENIAVPDHLKRQIVFKWPDLNIRRYTYAIVAPDEVAIFMYQGQVRGMLPPGRHRLDATEIPFLGLFADRVTGGNLYRTELYFVGSREYPGIAFGSRVDNVQDPVTGLVVSLSVEGEYSLRVVDPPTLLTNLTGTIDVTDNSAISDWVTQQLLKVLRANVTQRIVSSGWPILGLAAHAPEVEKDVLGLADQQLAPYGMTIARLGNFNISLDDQDELQLKSLARDTAYSRLAGSYQQYAAGTMQLGAGEGLSRGGQGLSGAFLAAGLGVGNQVSQQPGVGGAPPAAPAFAGGGGTYQPQPPPPPPASEVQVECTACKAANPSGARFCATCGATLPVIASVCAACAAPLVSGARFCSTCGKSV